MTKRDEPHKPESDPGPNVSDSSERTGSPPPPPSSGPPLPKGISDSSTGQLSLDDLELLAESDTGEQLSEDDLMSSDSIPQIALDESPAVSKPPTTPAAPTPPTPPPAAAPIAPATNVASEAPPIAARAVPAEPPHVDVDDETNSGRSGSPASALPLGEAGAQAEVQLDWLEECAFLARERDACTDQQPQRSALISLAAATAAEQAGRSTREDLQRALASAGQQAPLVALIRESMMLRGHYDDALALAQDDQRVGGEIPARVAALLDAAAIVNYKHGDHERALRLARRAVDLHAGHAAAMTFVATNVVELRHERQAAKALEQLASLVGDAAERAALLFASGTIHEFWLSEHDEAALRYTQATESDPLHVPALLALADLLERTGHWGGLGDAFEQLAEAPLTSLDKAYYLMRAGVVRLARLDDTEGAARCFERAAILTPNDPWPLARLASLYESTGRPQALVDVLRRRQALVADDHGRAAILTRIGWILHARISDEQGAITSYRQALEVRPGYPPAVRALQRLHRRRGELDDLVEILHREAEGSAPAIQRALICLDAADLLLRRLDRPEDAIAFYQRAIDLDPELSLAFWPLRRLLHDQGRHQELARLLEQQLDRLVDSATVSHLLLELARLQAGPLGNPAAAVDTLARAAQSPSTASATIELADLYAREGRSDDLVTLLLKQATATDQPAEAARLHLEAAHQLEQQGEHERAAEQYKRVLAQQPDNGTATWALVELCNRLGHWRELVDLLREQAKAESRALVAAELWCGIGRIEEEQLGQRAEAIVAYREALALDPQLGEALGALERLLLADNDVEQLIDILVAQATGGAETVAASDTLCRAAELADHQLGNLERAQNLYRQALERDKGARAALRGLCAVQCRGEAYQPAAETLERLVLATQDAGSRAALTIQLIRLREYRLEQPPTLQQLRQAIADAPFADKLQLEQLRVARTALSSSELAGLLLELGDKTRDDGLASGLLLEATYRYEFSDDTAAFVRAAEHAAARSGSSEAISAANLRRAYQRDGHDEALAEGLQQAASAQEPHLRASYLCQAAALHLRTGQRHEATRAVDACIEIDPQDPAALRLRAAIAHAVGDTTALARTLDQLGHSCASVANRLSAALQAADLWVNQLGDRQHALASLMAALRDDPDNEQAYSLAQQLFEQLERHGELAQLQAFRIERTRDRARRGALLREHAALLRHRLNNPVGAVQALAELLTASPGDVDALRQSVELLTELRRWSDAARALESLVACAGDSTVVRDARLQRARICFEQLHEPQQARDVLYAALELDPADVEAKRLLVRIDLAEGRWEEARQTLEALAAEGDTRQSVWAMSRLADIARTGFNDEALRERWEREALVQAATDAEALAELVKRFRERSDVASLANMAESVLKETTNAAVASALRLTLAELFVEDLQQPDAALEHLRERLVATPDCKDTNLLYAQALEQKGELEQSLDSYCKLLERHIECSAAYRGILQLAPRLGALATAGAAAAVVDLLGVATTAERSQIDTLESAGAPPSQLEPLPLDGDESLGDVREVLELAAPHMGGLYRLALAREVSSSDPIRAAAAQLARTVGLSPPKLSVEGSTPTTVGTGLPVPIQISSELAAGAGEPAFRFWVGRALGSATTAGALLQQLSNAQLTELIEALCSDHTVDPTIQQLRKRAFRAMPRKIRKLVEQFPYPQIVDGFWDAYRAQEARRADRMGLLISGSPRSCFSEIARVEKVDGNLQQSERLADLIRFSVSEDYARRHAALWTSGG